MNDARLDPPPGALGRDPSPPPRPRPDLELLVRQMARDPSSPAAFEQLVRCYGRELIQFFANRGFRESAQDLAQETLVRVYQHIGGFRGEAGVRTWILKIAANLWKNELRRRSAQMRSGDEVSIDKAFGEGSEENPCVLEPEAPGDDPHQSAEQAELEKTVGEAMATLPLRIRSCLELQYFQGLKLREIAQVQGVSVATVKSQVQEGKKRLKPLLEDRLDL